ncbi:MAG: hypothetical protein V5A22_09800 [Salinivenus sp.]
MSAKSEVTKNRRVLGAPFEAPYVATDPLCTNIGRAAKSRQPKRPGFRDTVGGSAARWNQSPAEHVHSASLPRNQSGAL